MAAQTAFSATVQPQTTSPDLHIDGGDQSTEQLLQVGTRLGDDGRYIVQEIVAIGGMATVYKAADSRLGMMPCAIKALFRAPSSGSQSGGASDEDVAAFREEARILASLRHPGIVAVRDFFEEETAVGAFAFIVQEFVDGQNLYDRHRRLHRFGEDPENLPITPVPEDQIALYGLALASTLDYLHTRAPAILYRDLKPHNVVRRTSDGQLILLDFGIARRVSGRVKRCFSDDLGTPGYAAPEQYERFGVLDARTDIYSLGVVLAELATGYNPRAENAARLMLRLDKLPGRLSPTLRDVLQRCLEPHPSARYASARELAEALENWRCIPRRLRCLHEPSIAWEIAPEPAPGVAGAKPILPQLARIGESGQAFAVALSNSAMRIIDAGSGELLAERAPAETDGSNRRIRLHEETGGSYVARVSEPVGERGSAELTVFDQGLKASWHLRVDHGRLKAAWLSGQFAQSGNEPYAACQQEASRLALASMKSGEAPSAVLACAERNADTGVWGYVWRAALPAEPILLSSCVDSGVVALDAAGRLTLFDRKGARQWSTEIPFLRGARGPVHLVVAEQRPDLAIVCGGAALEAIDLAGGASLWKTAWVGVAPSAPQFMLDGSRILLPTRECGVIELDAATGRAVPLSAGFPRAVSGLARLLPEADVFAVAEAGAGARLVIYDASCGKTMWRTELPGSGASAAPCISEEAEIIAVRGFSGGITAWQWSGSL